MNDRRRWTLYLSQLVIGSMKELFVDPWLFETQFDEISLLAQKEKGFFDFDDEISRNFWLGVVVAGSLTALPL